MQIYNDGEKTYILTGSGNISHQDVVAIVEKGKENVASKMVEAYEKTKRII